MNAIINDQLSKLETQNLKASILTKDDTCAGTISHELGESFHYHYTSLV